MQDLEIYVRDLDPVRLAMWLEANLDQILVPPTPFGNKPGLFKAEGRYSDSLIRISVYAEAFGKRFSSVVLEGERLPWDSDLACARSAWRALETEIRCSQGEWQEGDPVQDEKWWRLDERGEQLVVWN
ncbi:hypothetical protein SAMN05216203_1001 [Marinobacter daqiaonensis]|uniref:Uncharacterized protein n=1 Tax=Marinobacter daqiaonensis TaxID=650891 RepID=A0A1I6H962_9GAMM|nr:hypothetical protein [Marinobacter daqiaonensis]SFR50847.1 hypothetical protein SAMN05216203_1001 [Marinobacter daqiaonensis]